eukprot:4978765-Pyramimonas_sp.AAC.1
MANPLRAGNYGRRTRNAVNGVQRKADVKLSVQVLERFVAAVRSNVVRRFAQKASECRERRRGSCAHLVAPELVLAQRLAGGGGAVVLQDVQGGQRDHHQRRRAGAVLGDQRGEEGDGGDGLPQTHLVGEDDVHALAPAQPQPIECLQLVREERPRQLCRLRLQLAHLRGWPLRALGGPARTRRLRAPG